MRLWPGVTLSSPLLSHISILATVETHHTNHGWLNMGQFDCPRDLVVYDLDSCVKTMFLFVLIVLLSNI